jgi:hypothetical protein
MRFKGTLALLVIFAALGGYVYYSDFYNKEERQKQEDAKKRLFGGEAQDVTEITLQYEGTTVTGVRKGENQWQITNPAGLEADPDAWNQLATSFVGLQKDQVVSTEKTDLAAYGLDKPLTAVNAKLKNGTAQGVLFGTENPKKDFNYAKRADNDEVFLVAVSETGSFKKKIDDLRNKKVLDFESDNIDAIRISAAGKPDIEMQKSGMDWLIKKPVEAGADAGEVSSFLSSIQFSRAAAFADDKVDARAAGIENPTAKITLHDQKAGADRVLAFGKSPETDKYYAKDLSRPAIFILGTEILDKTRMSLLEWRDKSVVNLGEGGMTAIDEVDIVRGNEKLSLKRAESSDWTLSDGRKVQQLKISEMLGTLVAERALAINDSPGAAAAYGLDKPRVEVVLREKGKEVAMLKFGRDTTNPEGVYLKSTKPGILTVNKDLYSKFNVGAEGLLEGQSGAAAPSSDSK